MAGPVELADVSFHPQSDFHCGPAGLQTETTAASHAWASVLDAQPDEPLAWLGLGNAAWESTDWAGAEFAYEEVLAGRDPGDEHPLAERFARTRAELGESCPDA